MYFLKSHYFQLKMSQNILLIAKASNPPKPILAHVTAAAVKKKNPLKMKSRFFFSLKKSFEKNLTSLVNSDLASKCNVLEASFFTIELKN